MAAGLKLSARPVWFFCSGGRSVQLHVVGGRPVDPGHFDGYADIIVENDKDGEFIEDRPSMDEKQASNNRHPNLRFIDARAEIVTPGLIDLHVHHCP